MLVAVLEGALCRPTANGPGFEPSLRLAPRISAPPEPLEWKELNSVIRLTSIREIGDKISQEHRYYISSLSLDVPKAAEAIGGHWGVENGLHWTLDVTFADDASQVRKDHAPHNFGIVKKIAINALKLEKSTKGLCIVNKRLKAAMDNDYLRTLMCQQK